MKIVNVLPVVPVADFDAAVGWYGSLFGRAPDRRPMDGCVEWQLAETGGVQVYRDADTAGKTNLIVGLDDVDAHVATLANRGISANVFTVPTGQFRLAVVEDADGNTITFAQDLTGG